VDKNDSAMLLGEINERQNAGVRHRKVMHRGEKTNPTHPVFEGLLSA
jgi:hypothetical protein